MSQLRYFIGAIFLGSIAATIGRGLGLEPFDFWVLIVATALFYAVVMPDKRVAA